MSEVDIARQTWTPTHRLTLRGGADLLVMLRPEWGLQPWGQGWTAAAWLHPEKKVDVSYQAPPSDMPEDILEGLVADDGDIWTVRGVPGAVRSVHLPGGIE